ncbi:hypothetical protein ES707_18511 [subsurface metagenome]
MYPVPFQDLYRLFGFIHPHNNYGLPAFPPAQIGIQIEDINIGPPQGLKYGSKSAGMIRNLHGDNIGFFHGIVMASQDICGFRRVISYKSHRTDIGRVRH